MTDDDPAYRSLYDPRPDQIELRAADDGDEDDDATDAGMMKIRLPIASTGEVRNEGDDPLTADELRGMADQVDGLSRGVFPEHGHGDFVAFGQYSQFEKLGYWSDANILRDEARDDGEDLLKATANMPDPDTLDEATGTYRQALAILKAQAERGIPMSASIGWRDDEDAPGGVDLLEVSIVGIGADPRTVTEGGEELVARAAVDAGADPGDLVERVAAAVDPVDTDGDTERDTDTDGERPLGPPGDRDRFESFEECVATLSEDDDVSEDDAEQICGAWEQASGNSADASDAETQDHDMTDDSTASDDGATTDTDDEQRETTDGEDTEEDQRDDGAECPECEQSVREDANFCSHCGEDLREDDEMDDEDEEEEDDEEQDDDNEQAADVDDTTEQSADTDDLETRIDKLESELQAVRSGDTEVETPGDDADDAEEQSTDTDDDETEQRDNDGPALRDEWLQTDTEETET